MPAAAAGTHFASASTRAGISCPRRFAAAHAASGGVPTAGTRQPVWASDAPTVTPYLGRVAVEPFRRSARRDGRGVFVLVRTSNAGAGQFQDLVCSGRPLFQHVAEAVG